MNIFQSGVQKLKQLWNFFVDLPRVYFQYINQWIKKQSNFINDIKKYVAYKRINLNTEE